MLRSDEADRSLRRLVIELRLDADADAELTEKSGRQLRAELNQLDVQAVNPMTLIDVAYGAKGGAVDWGSLLVTFGAAGGVFTSVIVAARDWLAGHSAAQSIKITIDGDSIVLGRASAQEREDLIGAWVRQHSGE
jgi:hypothetical protein